MAKKSLWANDSPRDTWHPEEDSQGPCDRQDNQSSHARIGTALADQMENAEADVGAD